VDLGTGDDAVRNTSVILIGVMLWCGCAGETTPRSPAAIEPSSPTANTFILSTTSTQVTTTETASADRDAQLTDQCFALGVQDGAYGGYWKASYPSESICRVSWMEGFASGAALTTTTRAPITTTLVPGTELPYTGPGVGLVAGTVYKTTEWKHPVLWITPPSDGWSGTHSGCDTQLGSVRLLHTLGLLFIIPTPDITVEDAMTALQHGPFHDLATADTTIAGWEGRMIEATLAANIWPKNLGPLPTGGDPAPEDSLIPYFTVQDHLLSRGFQYHGGQATEIHVVSAGNGLLSIAIISDPENMNVFRHLALALVETLELIGEYSDACTAKDC
jgi:hypothetical protein